MTNPSSSSSESSSYLSENGITDNQSDITQHPLAVTEKTAAAEPTESSNDNTTNNSHEPSEDVTMKSSGLGLTVDADSPSKPALAESKQNQSVETTAVGPTEPGHENTTNNSQKPSESETLELSEPNLADSKDSSKSVTAESGVVLGSPGSISASTPVAVSGEKTVDIDDDTIRVS